MLRLGDYAFSITTAAYQELRRTTAYTWASQSRFGNTEALQFTGYGPDTIILPGFVLPEFNGGTKQIDTLRNLSKIGMPQTMIDGLGNIMGVWVVEQVEETQSIFAIAGVARKQDFTLTLRKFGELKPNAVAPSPATANTPTTLLSSASIANSPVSKITAITNAANATLSAASRLGTAASVALNRINDVAGLLGNHAPAITNALSRGQRIVTDMQRSTNAGLALIGRVQTAQAASSALQTMARDASTFTQPAQEAGAALRSSLQILNLNPNFTGQNEVTRALTTANNITVLATQWHDKANNLKSLFG